MQVLSRVNAGLRTVRHCPCQSAWQCAVLCFTRLKQCRWRGCAGHPSAPRPSRKQATLLKHMQQHILSKSSGS